LQAFWKEYVMKTSRVLELVGGGLGLLAFFLPWISFIISISLFDLVRLASSFGQSQQLFSGQGLLIWLEPVAAGVLLLFALLAGSMGKGAHGLNLIASLAGLGFLIYIFISIQSSLSNSSVTSGVSATSLLGIGFWAAGIAFVLGLIGSIMSLGEKPTSASASAQPAYMPAQANPYQSPMADQSGGASQPPYPYQSGPYQPPQGQSGPYQ
jgi:hypothetical protein